MAKEKELIEKTEESKPSKYWQWIKGENSGSIVSIKKYR